jgi:phosphatidate cytidylyltransferase
MLQDGAILVWLIFIGAWGSDTCAYCVGMLLGKHKVAPKLSPKKSVEGCIGGVVGAALIGFLYATVFQNNIQGIDQPQLIFAIIGAASSVISQIGDLAASAIKRNHNIKDYGTLIPGHGGILDRFDSIIFTAPIVYYLAVLL